MLSNIYICRDEWEENCAAEARQVRVLGVCWGADKIPKRLEVLVPRVNPTGLDGWEKIKAWATNTKRQNEPWSRIYVGCV